MTELDHNCEEFFRNADLTILIELIEHFPGVCFFIKDRHSRFMYLNQFSLLRTKTAAKGRALIGRTDFDIHPENYAKKFVEDDEKVMKTGKRIANRIELVSGTTGDMEWSSTTKLPIRDKQGVVIGLAGFTRRIEMESPRAETGNDRPNVVSKCANTKIIRKYITTSDCIF